MGFSILSLTKDRASDAATLAAILHFQATMEGGEKGKSEGDVS
jgi:hypothetical protein